MLTDPEPFKANRAVFKSAVSVHEEPFHVSVAPVGPSPPKANPVV